MDGVQSTELEGESSQRKSIRIVVVDDSPRDLKLLCEFLKTQQGIEVAGTASNGVELMKVAETLRPDLVITDLHMPRLSGNPMHTAVARDDAADEIHRIHGCERTVHGIGLRGAGSGFVPL